jgi:hypothetical protein
MPPMAIAGVPDENETATIFGHFCAEVPKSLHIGAYLRVFVWICPVSQDTKALQMG